MRAPLAYVGTRSRRPPSSAHTDWPAALPLRSQHAMSTAESASVKMPPGPEPLAARRSLAAMASTCVGSSPTMSRASASTAALSAGVRAPPKKVRPMPTRPWSVPELQGDELARVGGRGQADHERIVGRRAQHAGGDVGDLHRAVSLEVARSRGRRATSSALVSSIARHLLVGRAPLEAAGRVEHPGQQREVADGVEEDSGQAEHPVDGAVDVRLRPRAADTTWCASGPWSPTGPRAIDLMVCTATLRSRQIVRISSKLRR